MSNTTASNFLKYTAVVAGSTVPVLQACAPGQLGNLAAALTGAVVLDKIVVGLDAAAYPKNGAAFLALAASTPVTLDLTDTAAASTAAAGDTAFAAVFEVIFANIGAQDVGVSPGASNPWGGPLAGSSPSFTIPAGARVRWHCPAGWAVNGGAKTMAFNPGGSAASLGVSIGGA